MEQGQYAYQLCVNITCLSNAGSLQDAVLFAAVSGIQLTSLA
jgi:exosome complex RNA-binding protein Rrp42 (RNase PH superfamily)